MIRTFDMLIDHVRKGNTRRVAVAGAAGPSVLEALGQAAAEGLVEPVLVAPPADLERRAEEAGVDISAFRTVTVTNDDDAMSSAAVAEVRDGRADLLMKGSVDTASLLKAVLDKQQGLRTGRVLSHVAVVEAEGYPRLMLHTDGGINIHQDLAIRKDILSNAVGLARCLRLDRPVVAGLALVEKENPKLPETLDMRELMRWAASGELGNLLIEGPLAIDIALSAQAAIHKGIQSQVAGRADIFVGPNISAVNFVVKSLQLLAGARVGGLAMGAKVPIVLLSRGDDTKTRLRSLALGAIYDEKEIESRGNTPQLG